MKYWTIKPAQIGQIHYFIFGLLTLPLGLLIIIFRFFLYKKMIYKISGSNLIQQLPYFNREVVFDLSKLSDIQYHKLGLFKTIRIYNLYLIFNDGSQLKLRLPKNEQLRENVLTFVQSFI